MTIADAFVHECHRWKDPATKIGTYRPNHFLIWMGRSTPFIESRDAAEQILRSNPAFLHVFLHEYWHYLQNVSTFAGFLSFSISQHLLFEFNKTLLPLADGRSVGSPSGTIVGWVDLRRYFDGDAHPLDDGHDYVDVAVLNHTLGNLTIQGPLGPMLIDYVTLTIDCKDEWMNWRRRELVFGARAIEESIAHTVERAVQIAFPACARIPPAPATPYLLLDRLLRYAVGGPVTDATACTIGTLALLTSAPGPSVLDLGWALKVALAKGQSQESWCEEQSMSARAGFRALLDGFLEADIAGLLELQRGRGLIEGAVWHFCDVARRALRRRVEDPLFDLRCIFSMPAHEKLRALQEFITPCDVLQERDGLPDHRERDILGVLARSPRDRWGNTPSDYLRALQAQQDYLSVHIDRDQKRFRDSEQAAGACPYFTTCSLERRRVAPEHCARKPWLVARMEGRTCWYGTAVVSAYGIVSITRSDGQGHER